jgi:hypothetical protein
MRVRSIPALLSSLVLAACGGGSSKPSCADACAHAASICGQPPAGCDATCAASWSGAVRSCVSAATTCVAVSDCVGADADAGTSGDADLADSSTGPSDALSNEMCDNDLYVGEGLCDQGANTIDICKLVDGTPTSRTVTCSGTKPWCWQWADMETGRNTSGCCPAVNEPEKSVCTFYN